MSDSQFITWLYVFDIHNESLNGYVYLKYDNRNYEDN